MLTQVFSATSLAPCTPDSTESPPAANRACRRAVRGSCGSSRTCPQRLQRRAPDTPQVGAIPPTSQPLLLRAVVVGHWVVFGVEGVLERRACIIVIIYGRSTAAEQAPHALLHSARVLRHQVRGLAAHRDEEQAEEVRRGDLDGWRGWGRGVRVERLEAEGRACEELGGVRALPAVSPSAGASVEPSSSAVCTRSTSSLSAASLWRRQLLVLSLRRTCMSRQPLHLSTTQPFHPPTLDP